MQAFREMVRGWLGKTLLALLAIPFVFVGLESYFGSSGDPEVASVNGTAISKSLLDRAVDNQRQQLLARMGEGATLTPEQQAELRNRVLDNLIERELLLGSAEGAGYRVSEQTLQKLIRDTPTFQADGKFSPERYAQVLSQIGESPSTFPERARQEILAAQRVGGWLQSAFITSAELDMLARLDNQQRDVEYVVVPAERFLATVAVTPAEIDAYYRKEARRFTLPEQVSVAYIQLARDRFVKEAASAVTEDAIKARYEERLKALAAGEERQASHILITVSDKVSDAQAKAKADALARQVAEGADFAALAKANSQDPGSAATGGDLGYAGKGMFVPEFEQALFALKQAGDVSPVIKTPFGYHLIKLTDIRTSAAPSLASLRGELENEVRQARADELYGQAVEKVDALVYEAADLQEPAASAGAAIQTTPLFTRQGSDGLAGERKVIEAAFSDDVLLEGKNSGGITLADGSTVWLRVAKHEKERRVPLAEVTEVITGKLKQDKAVAEARKLAETMVKTAGKDGLAAAAAAQGLRVAAQAGITRRTEMPSQELLRDIFRAPHPVNGKPQATVVGLGAGGAAVVAVTAVKPGAVFAGNERLSTQSMVAENRGQQELQDMLAWLRAEADVEKTAVSAEQ